MQNNRMLELDAIRGLAAISVVVFHFVYRYNELYGHVDIPVDWARVGKFGVQLFFMVSGFVIYWTLNKVEKPMDFVVSRISRLYPPYWFAASITFLFVLYFGLPGRAVSTTDALYNLSMIQEYFGINHIDGVYWTLTVELTFYAWMFMFYLIGMLRYSEVLFIPVMAISVLQSFDVVQLSSFQKLAFMTNYLPFFVSGICFYKINTRTYSKLTLPIIGVCLVCILLTLSLQYFILACIFFVFFYYSISGKLKFLATRPLIFLGGISYPLYLLHQNIGYIVINKLYQLEFSPIISIFSALFVCGILSVISSKYVEKPSLYFLRNKYREYKVSKT